MCVSPDQFSLCNEMILRRVEKIEEITLWSRNINNVRLANGTVFIAETEKELPEI